MSLYYRGLCSSRVSAVLRQILFSRGGGSRKEDKG